MLGFVARRGATMGAIWPYFVLAAHKKQASGQSAIVAWQTFGHVMAVGPGQAGRTVTHM